MRLGEPAKLFRALPSSAVTHECMRLLHGETKVFLALNLYFPLEAGSRTEDCSLEQKQGEEAK